MRFKLEVEMDNAAFEEDGCEGRAELARILRRLIDQLDDRTDGRLYDVHGNRVGFWEID